MSLQSLVIVGQRSDVREAVKGTARLALGDPIIPQGVLIIPNVGRVAPVPPRAKAPPMLPASAERKVTKGAVIHRCEIRGERLRKT